MNVQPLLVIVFLLFFQVNSRMRSTSHHICWQIFMSNKKGKQLNKITIFFQKMKFTDNQEVSCTIFCPIFFDPSDLPDPPDLPDPSGKQNF